jgi:putative ABC transport system permease protein
MKFLLLILKNLRRNLVRSTLTALGTIALVLVVTLVWSILAFLDEVTSEKKSNLKAIVSERWQFPSQMPLSYADTLTEGAAREETDIRPMDNMTWQFFGGTLDPTKSTRSQRLFAFGMDPNKLRTMMDDLDRLPADQAADLDAAIEKMNANRQGAIFGKDWLTILDKRVGDRFTLYGLNYKGINLEIEVVGKFPPGGRYDKSIVIHRDYLNNAVDAWPRDHGGQKHPLADKRLNLVWLKVPDTTAYTRMADQIQSSPFYSTPSVKCETASSGIASFLDAYRDLIWGMRWLLAPACLVSLSLVIANAISISVRERRQELAVMKVLGFRPLQILVLVLGESLLLGVGAGFLSAALTWYGINELLGGLKFPIAFFPSFLIADDALWWGPLVGGLAALLGSVSPAWTACNVKVSEVFAKVA